MSNQEQIVLLFSIRVFSLAGESLFIPKTDQQAQKQPSASYLNADTELFLARHCELHAYDDIDSISPKQNACLY